MSDAAAPGPTIARALRAVSDGLLDDLSRLARLETVKRRLRPDDPERVSVAEEIERLAARVLGASTEERDLTADALAASRPAGAPASAGASIDQTPPRSVGAILDAWREAERRLAALDPDGPEAQALADEIGRLRAEYRATR